MKSTCVLYDYLYVQGGAEQLTQTLVAGLGDADLCVAGVYDHFSPDGIIDLGLRAHHPLWRALGAMRRFSRDNEFLSAYRTAVFSGMYAPMAVRARAGKGRNIAYCHTPPRFVYDLHDEYMQQLPMIGRPALQALIAYFRPRYEQAMRTMDYVVANSENVRLRLQNYLGLDAEVVYPPVDVSGFQWLGQQPYYLSLARLENYKRVDLIIDAFLQLPKLNLLVASGGSLAQSLRRRAAGAANIQFTDWLSAAELAKLIGSAIATLYLAKDEDFGMSPVESMAAGKPVIGVAEGGLKETLVHGETGVLLPANPTTDQLLQAIVGLTAQRAYSMRHACEARATLYGPDRFLARMREIVQG